MEPPLPSGDGLNPLTGSGGQPTAIHLPVLSTSASNCAAAAVPTAWTSIGRFFLASANMDCAIWHWWAFNGTRLMPPIASPMRRGLCWLRQSRHLEAPRRWHRRTQPTGLRRYRPAPWPAASDEFQWLSFHSFSGTQPDGGSAAAISRLLLPAQTSAATSSSRRVGPSFMLHLACRPRESPPARRSSDGSIAVKGAHYILRGAMRPKRPGGQ